MASEFLVFATALCLFAAVLYCILEYNSNPNTRRKITDRKMKGARIIQIRLSPEEWQFVKDHTNDFIDDGLADVTFADDNTLTLTCYGEIADDEFLTKFRKQIYNLRTTHLSFSNSPGMCQFLFNGEGREKLRHASITEGFSKLGHPYYWRKKQKTETESMVYDMFETDSKMRHSIENLANASWDSGLVGFGRDARNITKKFIKIKNVQCIRNIDLFDNYRQARQNLSNRFSKVGVHEIEQLCTVEKEVVTRTIGVPELDSLLNRKINEYFLFHGTKAECVKKVLNQGLDPRVSGNGLFGQGIYLSERLTKADQYTDSVSNRDDGEKTAFVVRALLGDVFVCRTGASFRRPPCRSCRSSACKDESHTQLYDSVLGVSRDRFTPLLFREFIVYDRNHVYPEFMITYERIANEFG